MCRFRQGWEASILMTRKCEHKTSIQTAQTKDFRVFKCQWECQEEFIIVASNKGISYSLTRDQLLEMIASYQEQKR